MKSLRLIASALVLVLMSAGTHVVADEATWASILQEKIASLDLSDVQKSDIGAAFVEADTAYDEAIAATRLDIAATLTDDQKTGLANMADNAIQKRLQGDTSARTRSIAEIADELGVTDDQSAAIRESFNALGATLDAVDANLRSRIKSVLSEEQLAKVMSWFN